MPLAEDVFFLDRTFQGSLQSQIRQIVASAILSGRFAPGEKLPSSRRLAAHLGVSRITVTLAYNELVGDDYVQSAARSGYFVSRTAPAPLLSASQKGNEGDNVDWIRAIKRRFSGDRLVEKTSSWRQYPYPFVYGQPDPALFNQANWRLCAHQALGKREFDSLTSDHAERDDPELVKFIARHTLPRRGILARPEQILVTVGAQNALWMVAQILLKTGSVAAYENPGYPGLRSVLEHCGCERFPIDIDEDGLVPGAIPDGCEVVFVTPSHQCPTAITMPMARRFELLELSARNDFLIVEDDYEFEMSFLKAPSPALKSLDEHGRVVYVGSFSKSLFPGLRLGYLVGSEAFIREARALRSMVLRHPPGHMQRTTANFLGLGHYDAMMKSMRSALHERRRVMDRALRKAGLKIAGSAGFGGSSFWIEGPGGLDGDVLAAQLAARGVLIEPGGVFFEGGNAPKHFFRLAYSSISKEQIPQGIALIARAMHELTV
ncbi:MAG TPA: PLP-dependent aminotransferase family protein [Devosia sp.]|nr:PLP-dependent aminotransferase family protein [Devosia sp.]